MMPLDCKMAKSGTTEYRAFEAGTYRELFLGWFNNHMAIILLAIQYRRPTDRHAIFRILCFLEDVEHHYMDSKAPQPVWMALGYLKRYFRIYPEVTPKHCIRALEMVNKIYDALGLKSNIIFSLGRPKSLATCSQFPY